MAYSISNHRFQNVFIPQQNDNSCVASSVAHSIAVFMNRIVYNSFFPSIPFLYYNGRREKDRDSGAFIEELLIGVQEYGIIPNKVFPYDPNTILKPPTEEMYSLAEQFPIDFTYDKYDVNEGMKMDFIVENLWNEKIVLADLKGGPMDHTIAIYGLDQKNKLFLCMDPTNHIASISFDKIDSFDVNDLYSIDCRFPNKVPDFLLKFPTEKNFESSSLLQNNIIEKPETYDRVIVGDNIAAAFYCYFMTKTKETERVLFVSKNDEMIQTNKDICDMMYGSFKSLDDSTLKFLYEMDQDFAVLPIAESEFRMETMLDDLLKPIGLDSNSKDLNYQIVYCDKMETLASTSFETVLHDTARSQQYLNRYLSYLNNHFEGLNLKLPFYVVLKIILPYILSPSKLIVKDYKLFMQKFLPNRKTCSLGTFLFNDIHCEFLQLHTDYSIDEEENLYFFCGSQSLGCYSDKVKIKYDEIYNTNSFDVPRQITFPLLPRLELYFVCSTTRDHGIQYGTEMYKNILKMTFYGSSAEKIMEEKPENIYPNILYGIENYDALRSYCPENSVELFMLHPSDFPYPLTTKRESSMLQKAFGFENPVHYLNTSFFGSPDILEYHFNIVEILISFYC